MSSTSIASGGGGDVVRARAFIGGGGGDTRARARACEAIRSVIQKQKLTRDSGGSSRG